MFRKMLKSDLKSKKGLNIILFVFITVASLLVFASACQFYTQITGESRSMKICRTPDLKVLISFKPEEQQQKQKVAEEILEINNEVTDFSCTEALELKPGQLDFKNFEEQSVDAFFDRTHLISKLPVDRELVFDLDDRPFSMENGTIAVSIRIRDITGAMIGDKIKLVTDKGRIYDFRITHFFKENYSSDISRYIISDADYSFMAQDFPQITNVYNIDLKSPQLNVYSNIKESLNKNDIQIKDYCLYSSVYNYADLISFVVTIFMIIISFFFIIIILMTIRFTMIYALKEEEKEIGMMRAIGIDSLKFRWMFAAKYIFFSITGGFIGSLLGFPTSEKALDLFCGSVIHPESEKLILAGISAVLFTTLMMIVFCIGVMRRINQISVIDAIHGENHGERFGKSHVIKLHKRRRMSVSFFLGLSDVLSRAKRYIFLIISFILGAVIILIPSYLYDTVVSEEFGHYGMIYKADFFIDFNNEMKKDYKSLASSEDKFFWEVFNDTLRENNIPAFIDYYKVCVGVLKTGGNTDIYVKYDYNPEKISCCEGKLPVYENEAAMTRFTALKLGINIGDEIDVEISEKKENDLAFEKVHRKLLVTGFIDFIEDKSKPFILMNPKYSPPATYTFCFGSVIESENKDEVIRQMNKLFNGHILNHEETIKYMIGEDICRILFMLKYVMWGTVIFVTILLTTLYMNIFLAEDTAENALLKSIGLSDRAISKAQIVRMMILCIISVIIALFLTATLGELFTGKLFSIYGLTGFHFIKKPFISFVFMPVTIIVSVLIPSLLKLRSLKNIDIRSISEE